MKFQVSRILYSALFSLFAVLALSSCDDAHRQQVQAEWQMEYDAYVDATRFDTNPPSRNLLSWDQQDNAAEKGRRLKALDQEKGTLREQTTYTLWCKSCSRDHTNDSVDGGCPYCGRALKTLTDKVMVKRYDGE